MKRIKLSTCAIGPKEPCLVIVDAGVNHNNDPERAFQLIKTAARGGANMVKFQTYKAETITTRSAPRYWNPKLDTDGGGTQYDTFKKLDSLPLETYREMMRLAKEEGIIMSSTPFDLKSVEFLADLGIEIFKISSSDITYLQLIKEVAETGKPVVFSTGAASIGEIEEVINTMVRAKNNKIVLQHCILSYPNNIENAHLKKMTKLMEIFPEYPVGYSDHTESLIVPYTAAAMGARTIEKHYTIDRLLPDSPDHSLSLDPQALQEMVKGIRAIEKSFGYYVNGYYPAEEKAYLYARKSIVAQINISQGTTLEPHMLTCKRPGTGIYPKYMDMLIGRKARTDIKEDTTITWDMIC